MREYKFVRVRWCMSGSVRSQVWAMVYVCASARACLGNLWCVFVCVSLCVCENVCTRFVKGGPIRRTFFCVHRSVSQFDVIFSAPDLK